MRGIYSALDGFEDNLEGLDDILSGPKILGCSEDAFRGEYKMRSRNERGKAAKATFSKNDQILNKAAPCKVVYKGK